MQIGIPVAFTDSLLRPAPSPMLNRNADETSDCPGELLRPEIVQRVGGTRDFQQMPARQQCCGASGPVARNDRVARAAEDQAGCLDMGQAVLDRMVKERSEEHTSELQSLMRSSY